MFIVPSEGGQPQSLLRATQTGAAGLSLGFYAGDYCCVDAVPDSDTFLLRAGESIATYSLSSHQLKKVVDAPASSSPRYAAPGYLLFNRGTSLFVAPFSASRGELTGSPALLVEGITVISPTTPLFTVSQEGTLIYVPGAPVSALLVKVDRTGVEHLLSFPARAFEEPRWSPDGTRIVAWINAEDNVPIDLWVADTTRGTLTRLTFEPQEDETPRWSPDGKWIAFSSQRGKTHGIYVKRSDGSGQEQLLAMANGHSHASAWSRDGSSFVFTDYAIPTWNGDIWMLTLKPKRELRPLMKTPFSERAAAISPDGRWLAYVSDESGRDEIHVQSYPQLGAKLQVSVDGGSEPLWSPRGDELFYRNGDRMMSAPVSRSPSFVVGTPKVFFQGRYLPTRHGEPWFDVTPDGREFLMVKRSPDVYPRTLNVISNWAAELESRKKSN